MVMRYRKGTSAWSLLNSNPRKILLTKKVTWYPPWLRLTRKMASLFLPWAHSIRLSPRWTLMALTTNKLSRMIKSVLMRSHQNFLDLNSTKAKAHLISLSPFKKKVINKKIQSKWETQSSVLQMTVILKYCLKKRKLKQSNSKIIIN